MTQRKNIPPSLTLAASSSRLPEQEGLRLRLDDKRVKLSTDKRLDIGLEGRSEQVAGQLVEARIFSMKYLVVSDFGHKDTRHQTH